MKLSLVILLVLSITSIVFANNKDVKIKLKRINDIQTSLRDIKPAPSLKIPIEVNGVPYLANGYWTWKTLTYSTNVAIDFEKIYPDEESLKQALLANCPHFLEQPLLNVSLVADGARLELPAEEFAANHPELLSPREVLVDFEIKTKSTFGKTTVGTSYMRFQCSRK
jgi:hypothetical protein